MSDVIGCSRLSEAAVLKMLKTAVGEARTLHAASGIAIVDRSGTLRAWVLMDGATALAVDVVPKKARTAAYTGRPTGDFPAELAAELAIASDDFVNLPGGLPIIAGGETIGAIAAGGESPDTDVAIAKAGLAAVELE
jgi:uncharacterized protein GlcG (DUF336 family)